MITARRLSLVTVGLVASLLVPSATHPATQPISALAPIEIVASGFSALRGIVTDEAGNVYVADREAGTVTRIGHDGSLAVVASGLERPIGLALDLNGRLLIAEERAGRVVRVEPDGSRVAVVSDVKQPRWLTVGQDGRLFIAARRLTRDTDPEPDDESLEPEVILVALPGGAPAVFAGGFKQLQGIAAGATALYAATGGRGDDSRADGVTFQITIQADGSAGAITPLGPTGALKQPVGLAIDRLGSLYVATKELDLSGDRSKRAVGKLRPDGTPTGFAAGLGDPNGAAIAADGHLYVADGGTGRVIRFRAPPPPALATLPEFTNQAQLALGGTTQPNARIDLVVNDAAAEGGLADMTGAFSVPVVLAQNVENTIEVMATAVHGDGLTSAPALAKITHDGIPPVVSFSVFPSGDYVRDVVALAAQATDESSGLATLGLAAGGQSLGGVVSPPLPALAAGITASWDTRATPSGSVQTITATATDRAGNTATVSRTCTVDNTPPDTTITGGPSGSTADTSVTFTFTGMDDVTPPARLDFAWRLDGGPWSAFAPASSVTVSGLTSGAHVFEVKARDLAGNEDPTPASRAFTVGSLHITITDPVNGAMVSAGALVVRGTVGGATGEVGVTVNGVPAAVQGSTFAAQVPVTSDVTSLTAVATSASGSTASTSIAIAVSPSATASVLVAEPATGVAPLTVTFSLVGQPAALVELDANGDGATDFTGPALDGQPFVFAQPGLYVSSVRVTDAQGVQTTLRAVVQVYDQASLDAILQAKWNAMKAALRSGDVATAVQSVALSARDDYRDMLNGLGTQLATIDTILTDIAPVKFAEGSAEYQMMRVDSGVPIAHLVVFVLDGDGVWRLEFF